MAIGTGTSIPQGQTGTPLATPLKEIVNDVVDKVVSGTARKDLFTGSYKKGPVRRDITFKAIDLDDATRVFDKYVAFINSREIAKVMKVGLIRPLALDLEDEIMKERVV